MSKGTRLRAARHAPAHPDTAVLTHTEATVALGSALLAHTHYLVQMPHRPEAWPQLPGVHATYYVEFLGRILTVRTLARLRGVLAACVARSTPAIGVAVVPYRDRDALWAALGLAQDEDDRDILIVDATDDGLNPLLDAALIYADRADNQPHGDNG